MDGIHDLGGMHGFGPGQREEDEPAFHGRWQAAVFAMEMAASRAGATGNADRFRHAVERIDPMNGARVVAKAWSDPQSRGIDITRTDGGRAGMEETSGATWCLRRQPHR